MANCKITRDSQGKIIKVLDANGNESQVFNSIAKLPHVESLEQAVQIYDEILKVNFKPVDRYTLPKSQEEVYSLMKESEEISFMLKKYRMASIKLMGTPTLSKSYAWDNFDRLIGLSGIEIREEKGFVGDELIFRAYYKGSKDEIAIGKDKKQIQDRIVDTTEFFEGIQESILKEANLESAPDRSKVNMIDYLLENYNDSVSKTIEKNKIKYPSQGIDIKNMELKDIYPKETNPHLYPKNAFGETSNFPTLTGQSASLLFRGIHPDELAFIRENGYIQSNQSYNIGDEVDAGVTVYATGPRTAFNYASGFAPVDLKPTQGKPNYVMMIENDPNENKAVTDVVDGYVKVKKEIPSNKILAIYSVDENGTVKNVSEELLGDIFEAANKETQITEDKAPIIESGFYSNTLAALKNLKDKAVKNIKGWINQLTDVQKNGGIRNVGQEITWLGLEDYLNEWVEENQPKNGNIPFEVIEQYVNDNQIEIVEVSKEQNINQSLIQDSNEKGLIYGEAKSKSREFAPIYSEGKITPEEYKKILDAEIAAQIVYEEAIKKLDASKKREPKYADYQLEGGENYREILLTLPPKKEVSDKINNVIQNANSEQEVADALFEDFKYPKEAIELGYEDGDGYITNASLALAQYTGDSYGKKQLEDRLKSLAGDKFEEAKLLGEKAISLYNSSTKKKISLEGLAYKSAHWDESNILAHIRLNERTLPNGERVLFIEEIQADIGKDTKDTQDKFLKEIDKSFDNVLDQLIKEGVIEEEC